MTQHHHIAHRAVPVSLFAQSRRQPHLLCYAARWSTWKPTRQPRTRIIVSRLAWTAEQRAAILALLKALVLQHAAASGTFSGEKRFGDHVPNLASAAESRSS